jgi:DinB superfamily
MTREEHRQKLESFGRAPALLSAALRQFPKKMWLYKVSPDRWSIHEMILHLADSEANAYIECRRIIAEPGSRVLAYNPSVWAGSLGYFHQSTKEALEIIRRLRRMTYQVLSSLHESVWANGVETSGRGVISLHSWLEDQERYVPRYIEQMREIHEIWARTHPPRKPATPPAKNGSALAGAYTSLSVRN